MKVGSLPAGESWQFTCVALHASQGHAFRMPVPAAASCCDSLPAGHCVAACQS